MTQVHHTQLFWTPTDPAVIEQCDRLMQALLDHEDGTVYDSSVSADLDQGIVTVEVTATGVDIDEAGVAGARAIARAVAEIGVAGIGADHELERRTERILLPA